VWGELGPSYADVVAVDVCTGDARADGESRVVGRRASQSVCSVQCCAVYWASCCVGRRVVLGVVLCWASCCVGRRVVLGRRVVV
jgi:hypothetical protein